MKPGLWRALILGVVLAGCQMTPWAASETGSGAGSAITESVLPDAASEDASPAETAPQQTQQQAAEQIPVAAPPPDPADTPPDIPAAAPLAPTDPPMLAQQRAACQRSGGQFMARGAGLNACVQPTRDAGRSCTAGRDCEGLCLARSGSCAPFRPLFGCHEVFTSPGRRETLCTD